MRFGVILPIQLKDTGLDDHFEELREEVAVAEEAGFDAVFLPEFHQARGGALVSPLLVGAALLQGTTRIRFGSAVLATPLHHPVRLAEDAIMLDWITRGRVVLGLGIAHQVPDFNAFGVPRDERIEVFEEVLDLLELCFAGEPYAYEGKHFTSEAHITPRPYTLPRPEIWVGAHSQSGLERAARRGRPLARRPAARRADDREARGHLPPACRGARQDARASASSARRGSATARRSASGSGRPTRCRCTGSTTTSAPTRSASSRGSTTPSTGRTSPSTSSPRDGSSTAARRRSGPRSRSGGS